MILLSAYGRKPESDAQVSLDWHKGLDFKFRGGPYCSIRDFDNMKQDFDTIDLGYFHKGKLHTVRIWNHPLAGITTYI